MKLLGIVLFFFLDLSPLNGRKKFDPSSSRSQLGKDIDKTKCNYTVIG